MQYLFLNRSITMFKRHYGRSTGYSDLLSSVSVHIDHDFMCFLIFLAIIYVETDLR